MDGGSGDEASSVFGRTRKRERLRELKFSCVGDDPAFSDGPEKANVPGKLERVAARDYVG